VLIAINTFIFELEFKIMRKLNKTGLALGVALAVASTSAFAGQFQVSSSEAVGVEATTTGSLTANIGTAGNAAIELVPSGGSGISDRVIITLDNGATFADSTYVLAVSDGVVDDDLAAFTLITPTPAGSTQIEFRVASDISFGEHLILSGSSVASQPVTITLPSLAAGGEIDIDAQISDVNGVYDFFDSAELFEAANQFSATITDVADETIDVNTDRRTFLANATSDEIELSFADSGVTNGVVLDSASDVVDIVLSGDMSGIASIALATDGTARGNFAIDVGAGTATFAAEASDVFSATSTTITPNVVGSEALATRSFTVQADLDFVSETDKNLVAANTSAGEWTINGLQAKVANLTLNSTGFLSWLKVVNEGTTSAEISADIIYTLGDGTEGSVSGASLGSVDAGGVTVVSEASILAAIGSPGQFADVSMTVTVAGQIDLVHVTAEKKASDGRVKEPVYYNSGSSRSWFQ